MLIPFEQMSDNARVWIYQAERKLTKSETDFVAESAKAFLSQWQAHGQDLQASFSVAHDQFLLISVCESVSQASGCSIDASVHLIKALESQIGISFMTSGQIAFLQDDNVELYAFNNLKQQVEKNSILPETMVFDNTVKTVGEFKDRWLVQSKQTWLSRYFK